MAARLIVQENEAFFKKTIPASLNMIHVLQKSLLGNRSVLSLVPLIEHTD
jgi:hypothetical protein